MIQLWNSFLDVFRQQKSKNIPSDNAPYAHKKDGGHDLGHASKCLWELDKEA